jgi:hypothetical protein
MALQQTTRELWASQGPFELYTIHGLPQQNIPTIYLREAVMIALGKTLDSVVMTTRAEK